MVRLRREAIAGPVIYDGRPAPVDATVCLLDGGCRATNHARTPWGRKQALWTDAARNRRIALACRALATGTARRWPSRASPRPWPRTWRNIGGGSP